MFGDKISYFSEYNQITDFVIKNLKAIQQANSKLCISVGGESGCGKTSLAYALKIDIEKVTGRRGYLFHGDDYFKLPPTDNHNKRLESIENVGEKEVDLDLLNKHILEFKKGNSLVKPLVIYDENIIVTERINTSDFDFSIVEGTYVSLLNSSDYKLFLKTTYIDTHNFRMERARDVMDEFNEKVLEIEHQIIKPHYKLADVIIDKDLRISKTQNKEYDF